MADTGLPFLPGTATVSEVLAVLEAGLHRDEVLPGRGLRRRRRSCPRSPRRSRPPGSARPAGSPRPAAASYLALPNVGCVGGSWLTPEGRARDRRLGPGRAARARRPPRSAEVRHRSGTSYDWVVTTTTSYDVPGRASEDEVEPDRGGEQPQHQPRRERVLLVDQEAGGHARARRPRRRSRPGRPGRRCRGPGRRPRSPARPRSARSWSPPAPTSPSAAPRPCSSTGATPRTRVGRVHQVLAAGRDGSGCSRPALSPHPCGGSRPGAGRRPRSPPSARTSSSAPRTRTRAS